MSGTLPMLFMSLGLTISPVPKTEINAVEIVKQEVQMQTEKIEQTSAVNIIQDENEYYAVAGESAVTSEQLAAYFTANGGVYPADVLSGGGAPDLETFCKLYIEEAKEENIRPEVAFAQSMKETGFLQFGGDARITQFNFAGLGATGGGVPGNSFSDVRTGIRAQIQHLKAYATKDELKNECVDERYDYVLRGSAPYVEWLGQQENPQGLGWATAENYGQDIASMIAKIREMQAE